MNNNLSWARLSASSTEAVKYWLKFIASVWVSATHTSENTCVQEAYGFAITQIDNMKGYCYSSSESQEMIAIHEALAKLVSELKGLDNQLDIRCQLTNQHGSKLTLGWFGYATQGRYLRVSYEPRNYPVLLVEWDTATGSESSFLGLPSTAEDFISKDMGAKLCPIVNHYRVACENLGIDVSAIPETGSKGFYAARRTFEAYCSNVVRAAEELTVVTGGVIYYPPQ